MSTQMRFKNSSSQLEALLEIINPDTGCFTCVGHAPSKNRRCRNRIAQHNRSMAYSILRELPQLCSDERLLRPKLEQVASLALCVRHHQGQVLFLADRWYRAIVSEHHQGQRSVVQVVEEVDDQIKKLQRELDDLLRLRQEQQQHAAETRREGDRRRSEQRQRQEETRRRAEEEARREEERREEEARHRAAEERKRQEGARQQEELRQEKARRDREEADRRREEARREREARQRADAHARQERERTQREKLASKWIGIWGRYHRDWEHMQCLDTSTFDEDVRESVPWPVESGSWQDVNERNVKSFLLHAPDEVAEIPRKFRSLLRRQAMRWHEDRLRHWFPRLADDDECMRLANLVMQVVNSLTATLPSL